MVEQTLFESVISFMRDLGFFKVILPFLISFTLVYAILDKTRVLGNEAGTEDEPKRSLNSILAFSIALFVVGTELVVAVINQALANMVIVLILIVFFLMTMSVFMADGGTYNITQHKTIFAAFAGSILLIFLLIFLSALGWLDPILTWIKGNYQQDFVATIIFLLGIAAFIGFIARTPKPEQPSGDGD
jgi:magnesium-transporting ATPase (P-type)